MKDIDRSVFDQILGKGEEIIDCIKPNKVRYIWLNLLAIFLFSLLIFGIPFILIFFGLAAEADEGIIPAIGLAVVFGLILIVSIIVLFVGYKKVVYCYTNKRIIIRSGIIGIDYKTLDYELIGGISVNVGLFDKMMKENTGTISFASAAVRVTNGSGATPYVFHGVDKPYELYKKIKDVFDNFKETKYL